MRGAARLRHRIGWLRGIWMRFCGHEVAIGAWPSRLSSRW
jgi:hypothetical protein